MTRLKTEIRSIVRDIYPNKCQDIADELYDKFIAYYIDIAVATSGLPSSSAPM